MKTRIREVTETVWSVERKLFINVWQEIGPTYETEAEAIEGCARMLRKPPDEIIKA